MNAEKRSRNLLWVGIAGCLLYVVGDHLYASLGRGQTGESLGLVVTTAYLDMGTWRMVASILCGFIGTLMYYMGFHRMYALLKCRASAPVDRRWVKLFRVAYVTGSVAWAYVHAMFMIVALIFKFVFQSYGDAQTAADIANRVFYCNAAPMLLGFILCDGILTVTAIALVWRGVIPLKATWQKVLATLCNPLLMTGVVGNLFALMPWPLNQLDHGSESFGHAAVLFLGLILLKAMARDGELTGLEED